MIGPSHVRRVLAGIYPSETTSSEELSDSTQAKIHLPEIESNENLSSSASDSVSSENSSFFGAATKIDKQTSSSLQVKPRMRRRRFIRSKYKKSHPANDSTPTTPIQISDPPLCPSCHRPCPPQALLFDEGYHSHCHYQFERMERWIEQATTIVFVGTSFAVSLTDCVLEHARREGKLVYNFNIDGGALESTAWLNVENVVGDVQRTLPALVKACEEESMRRDCDGSGEDSFLSWTWVRHSILKLALDLSLKDFLTFLFWKCDNSSLEIWSRLLIASFHFLPILALLIQLKRGIYNFHSVISKWVYAPLMRGGLSSFQTLNIDR